MSSPRLLSNRYEIGDTLGYGGMSEVHRGRDVRLGRDVAVKVLRADLARDPTFQLRFRREAQNAAALNHPAIVAVYDTGETESDNGPLPYIVMEYVDGRTLRDIVKSEGPLAARRAMEVMADASAALDFSHRHGIVHRDVKPANIMITRSGAVKVMDFGIARAVADGQAAVTQTAAVIGTAQYLSPEQARGEKVDARSDVYASGCVLFELLTGEPPFTGDSPVAVAYQHVREDPRKPSDVNDQVPASLDAVVLKALSKNPANRYQSAADMRADLVRVLSGQRPKAPMIMSDEERTSMLAGPPAATEMITPRRHRAEPARDLDEEFDDEKDRKRRKRWMIALVTAICVGVFALVAWAAGNMLAPKGPPPFPMPQVTKQNISPAMDQLRGMRLNPRIQNIESADEDANRVVKTDPAAGTLVTAGQEVVVYKGTGVPSVPVPSLYGKTKEQAQAELQNVGLQIDLNWKYQETPDPSQIDRVVAWLPNGNARKGDKVSITLGKAIQQIPLPDVRNMQVAQARQSLAAGNFKITEEQVDSDLPAGTVVSSDPQPGTLVKPGSRVSLQVSSGRQITMPNLVGKDQNEAAAALRALGWTGQGQVQTVPTRDPTMDGKVLSTKPSAGSKFNKDDPVVFYVGSFSATSPPSSSPPGTGLFPFG